MTQYTLLHVFLLFILSSSIQAQNLLDIENAWVREAPPRASVMVAYMTIKNPSNTDISVNSISSNDIEKVEIHLSKDVNGVAKMLPQKNLNIAARSSVTLKPGSYHLMLIKPKKWFKQGDRITLELLLSNKQNQKLSLPVKKSFKQKIMKCAAGKCGG